MPKQDTPNIDEQLDDMNHIGDGRILATKDEIKALIATADNAARVEQKIDTLTTTAGHQETGTILDDKYFSHNISKLEQELATLKGKS